MLQGVGSGEGEERGFLSILYLRCEDEVDKDKLAELKLTFNSLFEMLRRPAPRFAAARPKVFQFSI